MRLVAVKDEGQRGCKDECEVGIKMCLFDSVDMDSVTHFPSA